MYSTGLVKKLALSATLSIFLVTTVLILPSSASRKFPPKSLCQDVTHSEIESAYNMTPISTTARYLPAKKNVQQAQLDCKYSTSQSNIFVSVQYSYGTVANFQAQMSAAKNQFASFALADGIGRGAFIFNPPNSGWALSFLAGPYIATVKVAVPSGGPTAIEAFVRAFSPLI